MLQETFKIKQANDFHHEDKVCSQAYDSVTLEFNSKFAKIEQALGSLIFQIENLDERTGQKERKLDYYEQESMLDSFVFHGVKQLSCVDTHTTISSIINSKMSVLGPLLYLVYSNMMHVYL